MRPTDGGDDWTSGGRGPAGHGSSFDRMRFPRRASILALLGLSGAAAIGLPLVATSAPTSLPDLVSEPPYGEYLQTYFDGRLLLRFNGYVSNSASASSALEIRAQNDVNGLMQSVQQIGGSSAPGVGGINVGHGAGGPPTVIFETADDHNHYHLKDAAEYTLWNEAKTAQVALAQKTEAGFCLEDSVAGPGAGEQRYDVDQSNFCRDNPLVMGISPGWKDLYHDGLTYQWVDATNVQPGRYYLASRVDPRNVILESDEANNGNAFKASATTIPGFLAKPVSAPQSGAPVVVALDAQQFGTPTGARRFKILSLPAHGSLNAGVSEVVTSGVTYTPKAGYLGSDSFTYAAFTNGFAYPQQPAAAAASLVGNSVTVAISGAPASLAVGTSAQLSATVVNAPGGVNWSASAGSVSPAGLYVAPATPPPGGVATIQATSAERPEVVATVAVAITGAGPVVPAPGGGTAGNQAAGSKLLSALKVGRRGSRVIISRTVVGGRAGKLVFTATFGRKVVGRCVVAKVKPRTVRTCTITLKKAYPLKRVQVTAKLTAAGGKTALRRSFVIR